MKKLFLSTFIIAAIISISTVFAQTIIAPQSVQGYTGQTTSADITIINNQSFQDTFALSIFPSQFEKVSASMSSFLVTIPANSQQTVKAYFTVTVDADPASKSFTITSKSTSNPNLVDSKNLILDISRLTPSYIRSVSLDNYNVNPGDDVKINVEVFNLDLTQSGTYFLKIIVNKGDGIVQTYDATITGIAPRSPSDITEDLKLNKYTPPGTYTVTAQLFDSTNKLIHVKSVNFNVATITQPNTEYVHRSTSFNLLSSIVTIQVKNDGNVGLASFSVTESVPAFAQFLFSPQVEPAQTMSSSGRVIYSWNVPALAPAEQYTISYNFDVWRVWIAVAIIAGVVWLIYRWLATPEILKNTRHIGKITKGKEVTIVVHVKNKALHDIKDVEVVDVVPSIARVVESFETLKPKVSKVPHGTMLKWLLGNLKTREERVITYRIKSLVDVAGSLNLPPVEIMYTDRGQNRRSVASKQAFVKAE